MREDTSLTNRADLGKLNIKITDSFGDDVPFTATKTKATKLAVNTWILKLLQLML